VLLHLRRVVEDAPHFDSALEMLAEQRLTSPALFTLVGRDNEQRVVIERSPTHHALRRAREGEPLFATNDYRLLFQSEASVALPQEGPGAEFFQTTCRRYDALCRFFAAWSGQRKISNEELLYVLSDPGVIQSITAQHVVMRPRSLEINLFVPRRFVVLPEE
jgi:hypothetical protein